MKNHRLNSGSDSRPIIGSNFGTNITSQYRPAIIIQASIDHRSNIDSQYWLPTLRAWTDHRSDHIFLHGIRGFLRSLITIPTSCVLALWIFIQCWIACTYYELEYFGYYKFKKKCILFTYQSIQKQLFLNPEKYCFPLIYSKVRTWPILVTKTLRRFLLLYVFSCKITRTLQIYAKIAVVLSSNFYILNVDLKTVINDLENPLIRIFVQFEGKNLEFSQQWPPYWVRRFEFYHFDCRIVTSDLKNPLIFMFVQFELKTSNLVKHGRHMESAILNFWILTAGS